MSLHPEAKPDPSANALTHGLTARRLLGETEADLMRVTVDSWMGKHYPETPAEEALVATAAIEYVRYLRCVRAEEAHLIPGIRRALREWRQQRQHAIRRRAQALKTDPEAVVEEFHESAFGIDWMLRHWKRLLFSLRAGEVWSSEEVETGMQLLGHLPIRPNEPCEAAILWRLSELSFPKIFNFRSEGPGDPAAREQLKAFIAGQVERLETLRPQVWAEFDGPEADAIEAAGLVDTTKEGQLRQRYRREACRDYKKSLNDLNRQRNDRSKMNARETKMMDEANARRPERPAYVPPAQQPSADSRNEAPQEAESSHEPRHNPNQANEIRNTPPEAASSPEQRTELRTEERTEAPRSHPNAPPEPLGRPQNIPQAPADGPD